MWVMEAGLPRPEVNINVYGDTGHLLAIPDLLDVESGLVAEYDGADHRETVRHANDNARGEGMDRSGLTVVRVTGLDMTRRRRRLIIRLREGRREGLARDRGRDRWSPTRFPLRS